MAELCHSSVNATEPACCLKLREYGKFYGDPRKVDQADLRNECHDSTSSILQCCSDVCDLLCTSLYFGIFVIDPLIRVAKWFAWWHFFWVSLRRPASLGLQRDFRPWDWSDDGKGGGKSEFQHWGHVYSEEPKLLWDLRLPVSDTSFSRCDTQPATWAMLGIEPLKSGVRLYGQRGHSACRLPGEPGFYKLQA